MTKIPSPKDDDVDTLAASLKEKLSVITEDETESNTGKPSAKDTPPKTTVVVNGVEIPIHTTPKTVVTVQKAIYTKAARVLMDIKARNDIFERAVAKNQQPKFKMLNLKIDDPDKLDDTYNLSFAIDLMKANHIRYDIQDVFTIIYYDPTTFKVTKTANLYTDYGSIEVEDVTKSNRFYTTVAYDPHQGYAENLTLTLEYLKNNTDDSLVSKVNETYQTYPELEQGGPLFFKLLMDLLQNNSAEAAQYLVNVIKNLKITNFDGENIIKIVSLIRGAMKRLENLKDATGQSALPKDLANNLLDVFQTSLVEEFNVMFKYFHIQSKIVSFQSGTAKQPSIEEILKFAKTQYRLMWSVGKWTGVNAKINETVFVSALQAATKAGGKFTICFNCGGSHNYKDCPKQLNDARMKANRKLFKANKRKGGEPKNPKKDADKDKDKGGKYKPPTAEEKKNQSRRMIDGKLYYYHYKSKRWNLVNKTPTTPGQDPVPTPGPRTTLANLTATQDPQGNQYPPGTLTPPVSNQARDVAVVNATRQMESVFRGLLSQFGQP